MVAAEVETNHAELESVIADNDEQLSAIADFVALGPDSGDKL